MNVNEVISNRAIELAGGERGTQEAGPPERRRQHVAVVERHVPDRDAHRRGRGGRARPAAVGRGRCATRSTAKAEEFADIVKIGRTHLQDAVPLTLGQEFGGYVAQLDADLERIEPALPRPLRARHRRHRRRHRAQHAPPSSPSAPRRRSPSSPACRSSRRRTSSPRSPRTTPSCSRSGALKTLAVPPHEDRQRHPLARLGPARRARRADPARERARLRRSCRAR